MMVSYLEEIKTSKNSKYRRGEGLAETVGEARVAVEVDGEGAP